MERIKANMLEKAFQLEAGAERGEIKITAKQAARLVPESHARFIGKSS